MVSIEDIPAEQRWEIAARAASAIPLAYDIAFREAIGEKYDEIEQPIMVEAGKEIKNLASALGLPTGNARDIYETFGSLEQSSMDLSSRERPQKKAMTGPRGR